MKCGCEIDIDLDGTGPSAFKSVDRKAVKEHRCYECHRTINQGEVYRYESGIWDGGPDSYKTCMDCISIRETFFCTYIYGELNERLDEHIQESNGEILTSNITKLTDAAKDRVFTLIEFIWDDFYNEYPTQPALRLEGKLQKYPHAWKRPEWMNRRKMEMLKIDEAVV